MINFSLEYDTLRSDDVHDVQEVLTVRILTLLSQRADFDMWKLELRSLEGASGEGWNRRNSFLMDYSLARILHAVLSDADHSEAETGRYTTRSDFVTAFVNAASSEEPLAAEELWFDENARVVPPSDGAVLTTTLALLWRLVRASADVESVPTRDSLVAEFESAQFVS